jgi:hypothetical protein
VREKLESVHQSPIDYTVIFSGKKSGKVNGLYKPDTREIVIHNKNFGNEDGGLNENLLMFTAIHELAHHVMMAEKGDRSTSAHTQNFWATFHGLLDTAERLGVYCAAIDESTQKLIEEAHSISVRIAGLQRELGRVILAIGESCRENGWAYENQRQSYEAVKKEFPFVDVVIKRHEFFKESWKANNWGGGACLKPNDTRYRKYRGGRLKTPPIIRAA